MSSLVEIGRTVRVSVTRLLARGCPPRKCRFFYICTQTAAASGTYILEKAAGIAARPLRRVPWGGEGSHKTAQNPSVKLRPAGSPTLDGCPLDDEAMMTMEMHRFRT